MKYRKILAGLLLAVTFFSLVLALFLHDFGANARQIGSDEARESATGTWGVDIVGFNYTDRHIDSFTVNGTGGGNVFLSSQTSGGGKSACCATVSSAMSDEYRIRVRWQIDGCTYITRSPVTGEVSKDIFPYFKEADVPLTFPINTKPQHLEIHFYPDGTVGAQVTESLSLPRILLDDRRSDMSNFPRCPNDEKPE
jgi:hypothetical protein